MDNNQISLFLFIGSLLAGVIGSLSGMGGGIIIVPLLVLGAGVEMHFAIGASLLAVIATSLGAAVTYEREGYTNIRLGVLFLTITTVTAIIGAHFAFIVPVEMLSVIFGLILLLVAGLSLMPHRYVEGAVDHDYDLPKKLSLNHHFQHNGKKQEYHVHEVPMGCSLMAFAGLFSGLLGIGSGCLQVPVMDRWMRVPFKVAAATSNFVIGITSAASVGVYLNKGYLDPILAMSVVLGNLGGSFLGAHLLNKIKTVHLRRLFLVLIVLIAMKMLYDGVMH